jgi:hypothetical protein
MATDGLTCETCNAARENSGHWRYYDPLCIHCGARLIQTIGRRGNTAAEITQRRRVVLADWMAQGHAEAAIRELAASKSMAVAPVTKEKRK